ncbi:hypothetical protein [Gloeobacter violaceus]|uniref:Gll2357 protein n=1 Tax=Gloeobacter violaceus (strain ATCC 29082 / PCC 7421) TaxID=251221 RepID=Q7NI27_GLOVI|nr:hypothetical protein [Gloeobacter violaceus]BAC90298.1 gll2357 [Gloeobacter violaceus PCC 7421]
MFKIIVSPLIDEQIKVQALASVTRNSLGTIGTISWGEEPTAVVFENIATLEATDLHRLVESASRVVLDEPGLIQIYMELSPGYVPQLESEHLNILFKLPDSLEALLNRLGG